MNEKPDSLAGYARQIVASPDLDRKVELSRRARDRWRARALALGRGGRAQAMPDRPGRPTRPELLAPRDMPKRSHTGERGRTALAHALAHVELNAIDMTWDLIGRFHDADVPGSFFDDWVSVAADEARHFSILRDHLEARGSHYGVLPAHDGLWQAAADTGHDLAARVAVVPLVLEARGLDVTPPMIERSKAAGDDRFAAILNVIYEDEKRHVAFGARWFRFLCARDGRQPESTFHQLVRRHFRGQLKPPFNDRARSEAGLTPGFYKPLAPVVG